MTILDEFIKSLSERLGKTYEYALMNSPAYYIQNNQIAGVGYFYFYIKVKPKWYITLSRFIDLNSKVFQKLLLHYNESPFINKTFTRCHSYYIDEKDLEKKGGSVGICYDDMDIITALINHAETHDESNCLACKGEDPLQTHYLQVI